MKIFTIAVSSALLVSSLAIPADAVVVCAKQRSDGTFNSSVRIRECTSSKHLALKGLIS